MGARTSLRGAASLRGALTSRANRKRRAKLTMQWWTGIYSFTAWRRAAGLRQLDTQRRKQKEHLPNLRRRLTSLDVRDKRGRKPRYVDGVIAPQALGRYAPLERRSPARRHLRSGIRIDPRYSRLRSMGNIPPKYGYYSGLKGFGRVRRSESGALLPYLIYGRVGSVVDRSAPIIGRRQSQTSRAHRRSDGRECLIRRDAGRRTSRPAREFYPVVPTVDSSRHVDFHQAAPAAIVGSRCPLSATESHVI